MLPPLDKRGRYPSLVLTIIHAKERGEPKGRERIEWKLITNLSVRSKQDVVEKLNWYALRWKIEVFHKILKSGCKVEDSQLRSAERLVNLIATCCILSWRIFWMTMINRSHPDIAPDIALTQLEMDLLDQLVNARPESTLEEKNLAYYINKVARLGGYLDRNSDAPPGNIVMWRGLSRLTDIALGASARAKCG